MRRHFIKKNLQTISKISFVLALLLFISNIIYTLIRFSSEPNSLNLILFWGTIIFIIITLFTLSKKSHTKNFFKDDYYLYSFLLILIISLIYITPFSDIYIINLFLNTLSFSVCFWILFTFTKTSSENKSTSDKKQSILHTFLVILILGIAFALRFYKLDFLPPAVDEYFHLMAAKSKILTGDYNYDRAKFVTEIIYRIFKYSYKNILLARLPTVLVGTLSSLLVYFIGSDLNKKTGLISAYLFAICPFCIGMSRYIREYEYNLFFFLLGIFLTFKFIKDYKKNQTLSKSWPFVWSILFNLFLLYYYLFINNTAAVIEIIGSEALIIFTFFHKQILSIYKGLSRKKKSLLLLGIVTIIMLAMLLLLKKYSWVINSFTLKTDYLNMLFDSSWESGNFTPMWFSQQRIIPQALIICIFLYPLLNRSSFKKSFCLYLIFSFTVLPFVLLSDRYFGARYVYLAFPILSIINGYSINKIFQDTKRRFSSQKTLIPLVILLFLIFSPINSITSLTSENTLYPDPKTGISHYDKDVVFSTLLKLGYKTGDKIITTRYNLIPFWDENYTFIKEEEAFQYPLKRFFYYPETKDFWYDYTNVLVYTYKNNVSNGPSDEEILAASYGGETLCYDQVCTLNERQRIARLMEVNQEGWLVIDKDRNRFWNNNGFPLEDSFTAHSKIEYLGSTDGRKGFDFYKWYPIQEHD